MNLMELERALRQLRLGGMAAVLETRVRQAQAEAMAPVDLISCLVTDDLTRRSDRRTNPAEANGADRVHFMILFRIALRIHRWLTKTAFTR